MRHAVTILKWEIKKILSSWQKTLAIFLVPAAVIVFAVNLFPKLLSYLSTGSLGAQRVVVVNAPESFIGFEDKMEDFFNYYYMPEDEYRSYGSGYDIVRNGDLLLVFETVDNKPFEDCIKEKFDALYQRGEDQESEAYMFVVYNDEQFTSMAKADQFMEDVAGPFMDSITESYASTYEGYDTASFSTDDFNPITFILDHRSQANPQASHIIPGIMIILMYYCSYSLACDMIAMEKMRGFLNKLIMTPVSLKTILWGKALAVNLLVSVSAVITFVFLFLSSWINRSNDAGSLLPFGLLLMPDQLIYMILVIPATVLVMTMFCFLVAIGLEKLEDTTANLQLVLLILLVEFFVQMFMYWDPITLEYFIPIHNTIVIFRDILMSDVNIFLYLIVITVNLSLGLFLMKKCSKKLAGGIK